MKILFITESFPYPLDSGGKIVSYQMLKMLSSKHCVTLLSLSEKEPSNSEYLAIQNLGVEIMIVISEKRNPWYRQSKVEFFQSVLQLKPPFLENYSSKSLKNLINRKLIHESFDVIHIEHLSMAQYFPDEKNHKWVFQEQNIEWKVFKDFFNVSPLLSIERIVNFINAVYTWFYERNILKKVDQVIVLSTEDMQDVVKKGIPKNKILVIPPYIHTQKVPESKRKKEILFIGNLWWKPNLDGIIWFIETVFPYIQEKDSEIVLTVIGEGADLLKKYTKNISIVCLEKQKDLREFLRRAFLFILPFRIGQGIRIKALTAFSYGLPVVSTSRGLQGLESENNQSVLIADTSITFSRHILKLFSDPVLYRKMRNETDIFLKKNHNFMKIKKHLLENYLKTT